MDIRKAQLGLVWVTEHDVVFAIETKALARRLDVSVQCVNRWSRGDKIPQTAQLALRYLMGFIDHKNWRDWRVSDRTGRLCAPNLYAFMPAELEHWSLVFDMNRALRRELQKAEKLAPPAAVKGSAKILPFKRKDELACGFQ